MVKARLFILISHYQKLALTLAEYLTKMLPLNSEFVRIEALGGVNNGQELGTEPMQIYELIQVNPEFEEIFIFSDLGSATLGAESIAMLLPDKKIHVAKGAFVENTFGAYVLANSGAGFDEIVQASHEPLAK